MERRTFPLLWPFPSLVSFVVVVVVVVDVVVFCVIAILERERELDKPMNKHTDRGPS